MKIAIVVLLNLYLINYTTSSVSLKISKGNGIPDNTIMRTAAPTVFQCTEVCMKIPSCQFAAFWTKEKTCFLASSSDHADLGIEIVDGGEFKYVNKSDIPGELLGTCRGESCGEHTYCREKGDNGKRCIPFYQCINSWPRFDWYCTHGVFGACNPNNIGKTIWSGSNQTLLPDEVAFLNAFCERDCRKCLSSF